jgi:outer membrane biogenesis lipoprotein LolB
MKSLILALMAMTLLAGCSLTGGKPKETWQSTFQSVPYSELTKADKAGPPGSK